MEQELGAGSQDREEVPTSTSASSSNSDLPSTHSLRGREPQWVAGIAAGLLLGYDCLEGGESRTHLKSVLWAHPSALVFVYG